MTYMKQLDLFGEPQPEMLSDRIMGVLKQLTENAENTNKMLSDLIGELNQNEPVIKSQTEKPMQLPTDVIESIKKCRVEGTVVHLPDISQGVLPNYAQVRQALLNAGSKYKRNTFVFNGDAQPYIDRLIGGEKVNLKKEFQFFETPSDIADWLVDLAAINAKDRILEPSAGQGAIIKAINRKYPKVKVECYELMPENRSILNGMANAILLDDDFLKAKGYEYAGLFDRIIANPPFSKNQDIDHITEMYQYLKPGGRIVSVASKHWQISGNKKEKTFRDWLVGKSKVYEIEAGRFKESGTNIATCVIVIDKP